MIRRRTCRGDTSRRYAAAGCAAGAVFALTIAGCTSTGPDSPVTTPPQSASASAPPAGSSAAGRGTSGAEPSGSAVEGSPTGTMPSGVVHQKLTGVRIVDVSFVGNEGWLLGTADCLTGGGGGCTAIEHSTDGGRTWQSMHAPAGVHVVVPAADGSDSRCPHGPCVAGIRYASSTVGYLFGGRGISGDGSQALFMTVDGGRHWTKQSGGADALEAGDGNVIRVVYHGGCPPGCAYSVQLAKVGSSTWRPVGLPGPGGGGVGVDLVRAGRHAYIASYGHTAGGGRTATTVLWSSTDDGTTWTNRGEPCAQLGGKEYDSNNIGISAGGAAALVCNPRISSTASSYVTVTSDGGAHFARGAPDALGAADVSAVGAASPTVIFVSSDDFYRSADGGSHFQRPAANAGSSPGPSSWIGFSSADVGHTISQDHRSMWLTTDAGTSWTQSHLG